MDRTDCLALLALLLAVVLPPNRALAQSGNSESGVPKAIVDGVATLGEHSGLGGAFTVFPSSRIGVSVGASISPEGLFSYSFTTVQLDGSVLVLLSSGHALMPYVESGVGIAKESSHYPYHDTDTFFRPFGGLGMRFRLGSALGLFAARLFAGGFRGEWLELRAGIGFPLGGGRSGGGGWTR